MVNTKPRLFGLDNSNRDFKEMDSWGKNNFNSSFPVSLACYLSSKNLNLIFIKTDINCNIYHDKLSTKDLFKIDPVSDDIFFAFETQFTPFQQFVVGNIPRTDVVLQDRSNGISLIGLEIKLTALPDNTTCLFEEDRYGSEIVIRPDTIVYLACSIVSLYKNEIDTLKDLIGNSFDKIEDWTNAKNIIPFIPEIILAIEKIIMNKFEFQTPLILQPIWKTAGKSPALSEFCLDVFVWSNLAFINLFMNSSRGNIITITRQVRTSIWLFKMIYDYSKDLIFDHRKIIDELSYNTKNDKAFAVSGSVTRSYMKCKELKSPRINKGEIKNIILGGGQKLLSPERRFDAIIYNSPDLFESEDLNEYN